jgi:hypothetical protein
VTPVHVAQYRDARCDKHGNEAPVRANRELPLMSAALARDLELSWCATNPCRGARRNSERPRTRNIEQAGFSRSRGPRGTAARVLAATAVLFYLTSLRRQDIHTLEPP